MDDRPKYKNENYKTLEENTGGNPPDLGLGNDSLHMTRKIDNLISLKLKSIVLKTAPSKK